MKRALVLLAVAWSCAAIGGLKYPETRRADVVDDYHGTKVADPYRWLEDADSGETADWVRAQNKLSLPFLAGLPERARLQQRLTELWNYARYTVPEKAAGKYFYTKNDGLQNQAVLYVQDDAKSAPRVLLDPNTLSKDGTVALTEFKPSPDGRWLAYATAAAGSDWNEYRVRDLDSGEDTADVLKRVKFSELAWTRDNAGFFYSRYPDAPKAAGPGVFEELANQKLYYHRLGTNQTEDVLIHEEPAHPEWIYGADVTDDGLFLLIRVFRGAQSESALFYKYLGQNPKQPDLSGPVVKLIASFDSEYQPIGNEGSVLYLLTTKNAPRKRIVAVDLRNPSPQQWFTLVPEGDEVLDTALHAGRQIVAVSMRDATHRVQRYGMDGEPLGELKLPGLGALAQTSGETQIHGWPGDNELFFGFTSFSQPAITYRCELRAGRCGEFQGPKLAFNPGDYATEQVFYKSRDGTRVPMFISYKKGVKKNGATPTLLYGYGGFDISITPSFSVSKLAWMEQGGIFAVANLRGGGEYGKSWHEAGTLGRKQNVFDDFVAAAEYLIRQRYTSAANLAIEGRSNGGLLVGAVLNQRPELFAAALPGVGVMDMLRFHKFTIGKAWITDYGSSDDPKGFKYLSGYSPYHTIKAGMKYPAVLVTTADHDDRVVPGHSFKYAAALQAAQAGDKPVLIRIDVKAGHGAGKPTSKQIEEAADVLAFITQYTQASP